MPEREEPSGRSRRRKRSPKWPSLEQQLTEAQIVHGSALDQLIRDNQEFDLLHDHEADDKLGFPPWLRVYWRKAHPEADYLPDDPSGGYPRALKRIHAWMLAHQDLESES